MATNIKLSSISTGAPKDFTKEEGHEKLALLKEELIELQNVLYAQRKYSLLVILQGMDASGKDGVIKNVFSGLNPMGCNVASFKRPTKEELAHDFLWRVHAQVPANGMIVIFNRSQYEDVLIQRVHKDIDMKKVKSRFVDINNFEKLLVENGTVILKFYLHISKEEQLKSLNERSEDPKKKWKYDPNDLKEREHWDEYMEAYEDVFKNCNDIPWTMVPSDQNWYKEYIVAKKAVEALKALDLKYPDLNT